MWIIYAIGASVFWGITYVLNEQIYKHISVISTLAITLIASGIVAGLIGFWTGAFEKDLETLLSSNRVLVLLISVVAVFIIAEIFIALSIVYKNATIAGLIEISYPIFIAIFSYLLFKENQLNTMTAVGGLIIFLGIGVIYLANS